MKAVVDPAVNNPHRCSTEIKSLHAPFEHHDLYGICPTRKVDRCFSCTPFVANSSNTPGMSKPTVSPLHVFSHKR